MAHKGPPIDWVAFGEAGEGGRFMELLVKLPRARWAERHEYGDTLLHFACCGPNVAAVVALVQSGSVNVNARNTQGWTPAHYAVSYRQSRVVKTMCAAAADLRARDGDGNALIDHALMRASQDDGAAVRVLVANGVRLSTVREANSFHITPELEAFERGVLRCRATVVALMQVKRASGRLVRWDKFLLLELALCVWSTRYDNGW